MKRIVSPRSVRCRYALLTVAAFVFVACAGSDDTAETAGRESTAVPVETAAPAESEPAVETSAPAESDPLTVAAPSTEPAVGGVVPEGFTTTMVRITEADGSVCDVCLWLADEPAEHNRGLMGVTDLGEASGMIFVFDQPTLGAFFMFQTVTPLSIAWFSPDGVHVSSTDMAPCLDENSAVCARYSPTGTYQSAIEVFQGDLETIGVGAGSSVHIVTGTEATHCPLGDQ